MALYWCLLSVLAQKCAAAKELGQSYIGFEINPDYVRLAEKMVDNKKSVAKLF